MSWSKDYVIRRDNCKRRVRRLYQQVHGNWLHGWFRCKRLARDSGFCAQHEHTTDPFAHLVTSDFWPKR